MTDYDKLLGQYMESGKLRTNGLPTTKYCADKLSLSEACFCDVLLHKTGLAHECYCQIKRIEIAKRKLTDSAISLQQLVADLGFPSVQYFSYIFKKLTGCAPQSLQISQLKKDKISGNIQSNYISLLLFILHTYRIYFQRV